MWRIDAILTGKIAPFTENGETSAIAKHPVDGPLHIGFLGIDGDSQADLFVHGGPDKAIHHYPRDHYGWWHDRLPDQPLLTRAGAFGENISTRGLTEKDVCIGDRFRLGTALVEVCQGRQPCWKQAHRLDNKKVVATMVKSGRSGWYYRVIEEGTIAPGDTLVRLERTHPQWSVERVTGIIVAGRERNVATLRDLAGLRELAEVWRIRATSLAQ